MIRGSGSFSFFRFRTTLGPWPEIRRRNPVTPLSPFHLPGLKNWGSFFIWRTWKRQKGSNLNSCVIKNENAQWCIFLKQIFILSYFFVHIKWMVFGVKHTTMFNFWPTYRNFNNCSDNIKNGSFLYRRIINHFLCASFIVKTHFANWAMIN
jgi:hypothetical protein